MDFLGAQTLGFIRSFGLGSAKMAHLPLILGPTGRAFQAPRRQVNSWLSRWGLFKEALINFMAYLGWSYKDNAQLLSLKNWCEFLTLKAFKAKRYFDIKNLTGLTASTLE